MALEFVEPTGVPGKKIAVDEVTIGADTVQIAVSALVIQPDGGPPVLANTDNPFPVTIISSALPTGAATAANQATMISSLSGIVSALGGSLVVATHAVTQSGAWTVELGATDNAVLDAIAASLAGTLTVGAHAVTNAGTFAVQAAQAGTWNITNISGTISLPTGAATAAKQPALGTAGVASADVLTVQGIAAMTPLLVTLTGSSNVTNAGTFAVQAAQAGAWTVDLGATDNAVLDAIAASLAGTLTVGTHAVTQSGAWTVAATQSGSWTVELGAVDNAVLDAIAASLAGTLTVSTHAVTQSGTWNIGTVTTVTTVAAVTAITSALPAGSNHLGQVGGNTTTIAPAEKTRPADATAYAALDAVSDSTSTPTVWTFSGIARTSGGTGYVTKVKLVTDQSTCTARFRLHLFYTSPTAINDNAAHTLLYTTKGSWIGAVTLPACATEGAGSTAAQAINDVVRLAFGTAGSANLFGLLETLDAFTPASQQKFYIELTAENN